MICIECPICSKSEKFDPLPTSILDYDCPCKKARWTQGRGWFISFELLRKIKMVLFTDHRDQFASIHAAVSSVLPKEMLSLDTSMDTTVVRLFCPNDKCLEKGFITRTKAMAEKVLHICDSCKSPLKW